jgi:hypothetical protein
VLESIQKLAPWMSGLPLIPKIAMTIILLLACFVVLYIVWSPPKRPSPENDPGVKEAYERMVRVLARIQSLPNGEVLVDGRKVASGNYASYLPIAKYVLENPENIKGAHEVIWQNGGESRSYTNETQGFEAVVSNFFMEWEHARGSFKYR